MRMMAAFEKGEKLRFIGHLDLMRTMQRALRRSHLPIKYSNGFNPHIRLSFAAPLSVGVAGRREMMEVPVEDGTSPEEFIQKLNACLPPDLQIVSAKPVSDEFPTLMSLMAGSEYSIRLPRSAAADQAAARFADFMALKEYIAVRRTKAPLGEPFDETYTLRELPALLPQADAVLCALPATRETQHVMGGEQFALMKRASVFVNVGRGSAVDTDALAAALQAGRPGAAALDVTDPEPLPAGHPLRQCPNVFITPHIAGLGFGHRPEVTDYITSLFTQNLRLFLAGKPLKNEVDMALGYTKKASESAPVARRRDV